MSSLLSNEQLALQHAIRTAVICTCTLFLLVACRLPGPGVRCGDPGAAAQGSGCGGAQPTDYSGHWNETAKNVADEMIGESMLEGEWLQHWEKTHEGRPTVIVGPIKNKTMQYIIEEEGFINHIINHIERNLVTSDTVQFASEIEEKISRRRHRRQHMQHHGVGDLPNLRPKREMAAEMDVDFMVQGTISSKVPEEQSGDTVRIFYTVTLELLNLDANQKAWHAEKEIKKMVPRSKVSL